MTHPLIARLTAEFGYPYLDTQAALADWLALPGLKCAFVPGDAARNLETADVAVILPELHQAFQRAFACAVIGDAIEAGLRETSGVLKTPSLIFFRGADCLGGIARVRDWDDYMSRIPRLLAAGAATA